MNIGAAEIEVLVRVIPLAIGASFTPSLLGLQLLSTSSPKWIRRSIAVASGSGIAFLLACILLTAGFASLPHPAPHSPDIIGGFIWSLAAVVLAGVTVWLFLPHPDLAKKAEQGLTKRITRANTVTFFAFAFALSIKDITSFAMLVPAIHDVTAAQIPWWLQLPTIVLIYVIAMVPVLLPPLWRAIRGEKGNVQLTRLFRYTMDHQFKILGVISALFAIYCFIIAIGPKEFALVNW
ncbi:GAP family protein [Aurantimicrobium minutum]|uniref:GAP family protein n=1 Tax=Aurantimicrobium minutum TaxID=708131 RepID=UPI002476AA09|nr:GAP family protein [Aurantimicrobium minutum]MDH6422923.1 hypothetical protein [Aurantimicrobium minutum]